MLGSSDPSPFQVKGEVGGKGSRATPILAQEEAASSGASSLSLRAPFQMVGKLGTFK